MHVGTEVEYALAHRLMDYDGKCASLHGHNYRIVVSVSGRELSPNGLLLDFKVLKSVLQEILEPFDHSTMLRDDDPLVPLLLQAGKNVVNAMPWNPTAENFATWIQQQFYSRPEFDAYNVSVRVYETSKSYAEVSA